MRRLVALALAALVLLARAPATGSQTPDSRAQDAFDGLVGEYLAFHFYFNPVEATSLGVHDYDHRLPDLSQDGLFGLIAAYHRWLERVRAVDRSRLRGDAYWDHRILELGIRHRLLELEEIRSWERNPLLYVRLVTEALEPLARGRFGTDLERMGSAVARERQVPELLSQARLNLLDPPRVATELALDHARGAIRLVRDELPGAFEGVPPGEPRDRFERINRQTVEELRSFAAWLEEDLLPRSRGDFRLGPDVFRRALLTREHLDVPVEELIELSRAETERYRERLESAALELDPSRPPAEVIRGIGDAPGEGSLLELMERRVREAREFVVRQDLLTLPEGPTPRVEAAPPSRPGPVAALSTSGPFEDDGMLAPRLRVQLGGVDGSGTAEGTHRELLAPPAPLAVAAREAYPGRWVQALYLRDVPSRVRKVFRPEGLSGGWSLYAEEAALDRGLGGGDARLRIVQLRWALVALVRLRAGLHMHLEGGSVGEGARLFREAAHLDVPTALREARRLVVEPLLGSEALGKMQITRLRTDYREHLSREGETWVLANFHDRFLRIGTPVAMARKILMPDDRRPPLPGR